MSEPNQEGAKRFAPDLDCWRPGAKVITPKGPGVINFVRLVQPACDAVASASVKLDARRAECCYEGTIFVAADVRPRGAK